MKSHLMAVMSVVLVSLVSGLLNTAVAAPIVFDLQADWSDVSNPNGAWSYNDGGGAIINHVADYLPGAFLNTQPAWVLAASGAGHIPSWILSTNNVNDWLVGDVVTHTWDSFNSGAATADSNVTWTSPSNGIANISGAVWMAENRGRAVNWSLAINGTAVTGGSLSYDDVYDRASPFSLATGTGGSSVLTGVSVNTGDEIKLSLVTPAGAAGEWTGVNLGVELAAVPVPAAVWLFGSGLLGLIGIAKKREAT